MLYGSGKEQIRFKYLNEKGTRFERSHSFEGIIPNLERRYRETDSHDGARGTVEVSQQQALPGMRTARACAARRATC